MSVSRPICSLRTTNSIPSALWSRGVGDRVFIVELAPPEPAPLGKCLASHKRELTAGNRINCTIEVFLFERHVMLRLIAITPTMRFRLRRTHAPFHTLCRNPTHRHELMLIDTIGNASVRQCGSRCIVTLARTCRAATIISAQVNYEVIRRICIIPLFHHKANRPIGKNLPRPHLVRTPVHLFPVTSRHAAVDVAKDICQVLVAN